MGKTLDDVVTNFQSTGNCEIDVDLVCDKWNHTWCLNQWVNEDENKFTLIKFKRLGTPNLRLKIQISIEQAEKIIERLVLDREPTMFNSGKTWRHSDDFHSKLKEYNSKRRK